MSRANPRFHRTNPVLPAPTANVVMLTIFGTLEQQLTLNILYYMDTSGTVASITNLGSFLSAWITANQVKYSNCLSSDGFTVQFKAQYLNAVSIIPQYNIPSTSPIPGNGPAGHEPTTVAALLSKATQVKGQSGRGRFYLPAVPSNWVTASTIQNAFVISTGQYGILAAALNNQIVGGGITYTPGIFSRRGYNKVTGVGGGFSPMSTVTPRPLLATIRRRRIGRGK